jgi:hypothetical protein
MGGLMVMAALLGLSTGYFGALPVRPLPEIQLLETLEG